MPAEGASPAIITDHPFEPRGEWWTVCRICGLAEAAHARSSIRGETITPAVVAVTRFLGPWR